MSVAPVVRQRQEDGRRFKASLRRMPCLSHPTLKNPLGVVGERVGYHRSLLCLFLLFLICFSFFLPARSRFTDKERNLLCAMAMTPDKGVMMRF